MNWPHQNDVDSFYGNPRGENGDADPDWVAANIVYISAPWKLVTAWDFEPVKKVKIHKKCAESLSRVFDSIWLSAGKDQKKINEWGMHLYAGGFTFKPMKNKTILSMHSWGCAIDFDSARNGYNDHTPHFLLIPPVLAAFENENWTWGGKWKTPDGMHWQAAKI